MNRRSLLRLLGLSAAAPVSATLLLTAPLVARPVVTFDEVEFVKAIARAVVHQGAAGDSVGGFNTVDLRGRLCP